MIRRLTVSWLCALLMAQISLGEVLKKGDPSSVGMSAEQLGRIDEVIKAAIEAEETPGAVVLVARQGKIVYRKAFGDRARVHRQEPMTLDTIFDIASLTKVIATATAVMILVEEGKIALTERVVEYLPDFAAQDDREKGSITLLNLLTHYSGLRPDVDLDDAWTGYETAIELAYKEELVALPGERFIYSDINYFVLAEIIRQVTGKNIHEFTQQRIFQPLGMKDTGFLPPPHLLPRIAPTEFPRWLYPGWEKDRMLRGAVHDPTTFRMGGLAGHAGLFSTAEDTAIFAQMILNLGIYNGTRILSPLSVLTMTTPQSPVEESDLRGIGFDIRSRFSTVRGSLFPLGSFGHTGFTGTSLWIDPFTQTFLILFTSRLHPTGEGDVVPLRKKVASVVAAAILDIPESLRERFYH